MNELAIRAFASLLLASLLVFGGCRWQAKLDAGQIADLKIKHAAVLTKIAAKSQEAADKASVAKSAYYEFVAADQAAYTEGVKDAYERGKLAASGIGNGTVRVRTVWRDQCPKAVSGQGPQPAGGSAGVDQGRADAIGRVLGQAGEWDEAYGLAYGRLRRAQELLNTCYEERP